MSGVDARLLVTNYRAIFDQILDDEAMAVWEVLFPPFVLYLLETKTLIASLIKKALERNCRPPRGHQGVEGS